MYTIKILRCMVKQAVGHSLPVDICKTDTSFTDSLKCEANPGSYVGGITNHALSPPYIAAGTSAAS
jgi:hypothetical protein